MWFYIAFIFHKYLYFIDMFNNLYHPAVGYDTSVQDQVK